MQENKQLEINRLQVLFYRLKDLVSINRAAKEYGNEAFRNMLEGDWEHICSIPQRIVESQGTWCAVVKVRRYFVFVQTVPEVENNDCEYDQTFDFLRIMIAKESKPSQNACYPQILPPGELANLKARCGLSPEDINGGVTTRRLGTILEALERDSWRKLRNRRPNRDDRDTLFDEAKGVAALERAGKLSRHRLIRRMQTRWTQPSELTF